MNTRRNAAQRLEEEVANAGAPPPDYQAPPLEDNANVDQASVNPPPMTEAEMRSILAQMAQAMTTQAQGTMVQAQDMMAQANRDVASRPHQ